MDDERIVWRTAFDLEDFPDGVEVQDVGSQPVDRFRRKRNETAGAQDIRRTVNDLWLRLLRRYVQNLCFSH